MPERILQTPRLTLRKLQYGDIPFMITLMNSQGWLTYIGDRNVRNHEQGILYLDNGPLKSYREHGFGLYLVQTLDGRLPLGMCGLLKRNALPMPDLGFALLPEHNGKGYAFEAAAAVLNYGHNVLHLPDIAAITMRENSRSINLLGRLEFQLKEEVTIDKEQLLLYIHQSHR